MKKVLLRIVFQDLWQAESVQNEFWLGFGWMILLWIAAAAVGLAFIHRKTGDTKQVVSSGIFWLAIPIAIFVISKTNLPVVQSGVPVFGYGFMLFVGFSTATWLTARRAKSVSMNPEIIWDLMMWILIPGLIGARIIYLLQYGSRVFKGAEGGEILLRAVALWDGGIVFYGCIVGGIVGLLLFCRRNNIRPMQLADVLMPSVFIGLGFGRIGCFLYGCCFGAACGLPWAVEFPVDSLTFERLAVRSREIAEQQAMNPKDEDLQKLETKLLRADGEPITEAEIRDQKKGTVLTTMSLHPSQIYSSALAFLLAGLLTWYFPRRQFEGSVFAVGWMLYAVNRCILEAIRDDEPGRLNTGFTFSQLFSMAMLLSGLAMLIWLGRKKSDGKNKQTPATA